MIATHHALASPVRTLAMRRKTGTSSRAGRRLLGHGARRRARAQRRADHAVGTRCRGASRRWPATRRNARYLPELELPAQLNLSADLAASVRGADGRADRHAEPRVRRVARAHRRRILRPARGWPGRPRASIRPSGRFLHELAAERLPDVPAAIVTGPSFAREVAQGLPTAVTVHSATPAFAQTRCGIAAQHTFSRLHRQRRDRRRTRRRDEERARRRDRRRRRHEARASTRAPA